MKIGFVLSCSALALLFLPACGGDSKSAANQGGNAPAGPETGGPKKPGAPVRIDTDLAKQTFGNPPPAPAFDNPITPAKIALGKKLFQEKSLSKNGNISCASCHDLANYGQDGKPTSPGTDGKNGERNAPSVFNASRQFAQFWDGRAATVEEQAIGPVLNPIEHGIADEKQLVEKIKANKELADMFTAAFPGADSVTAKNFQQAIGAFERTLNTKSKFEEFLAGKAQLTNEEKAGFNKFIEVGCHSCHEGSLFGGGKYQKLGVNKPYPTKDEGRFAITKADADKFMFKVPSLLNVEKTGPYLHDGSKAKLEDVIVEMADYQTSKQLKPEEVESIVAFLKTLTGPAPKF